MMLAAGHRQSHELSGAELLVDDHLCHAARRALRLLPRDKYEPVIRKAWPAIQARIAANGELVDVCTGTGKQRSLADYRHRSAILGIDARGGAIALLVATEMAAWERGDSSFQRSASVVFRSAKERPFAERKATMEQRRLLHTLQAVSY